ncbi:putative disease resistance protein At4g27220 [Tasmannia lanceolata]|uniref:putative disease resistance protein At4g27220 n=1 Tax=Tasmannia lanceolata TaxID=3420 RepID=UPI004062C2E2
MEAVVQAAGETVAQLVRTFRDLSDHVENLNREMKDLKTKCLDTKARIQEAERQVLRPKNQVLNWVTEVANLEADINSINSEFDQMSRYNVKSRIGLGKRVIRMTEIVVNLKGRGDFDEVAVCPSPPRVVEMPTTLTHGQESYEETLWSCLHDENYSMVCVHGMGGVGKTTLMKTINNKLVGTQDFKVVIWVTVSKDLNIERTQLAIGGKLGLLFGGDDDQESRGRKIFARLKNSRYVLMLDDLWEEIILDDVGIPKPDKENKCKIVLSTRFLRVSNAMDVDMQFKVKTLGGEEAWNLFHEKTGEVVLLPDIQALAVEVVKECGGLPLAIITVGRAMRGKERKEVWQDALRALKESAVPEIEGMEPKVFRSLKLSYDCLEEDNIKPCFLYCALFPEGMEPKVFRSLKLSYDCLEEDNIKPCFLHCALFPEDTEIYVPKLVKYWTMEGFANNVDNLEDASNKGHRIIERLKDACLLEELYGNGVKMHDLIRDLAIWITSSSLKEGPKFLVKAGMGLKEAPKENMWEGVERVSLMRNQIERLPTRPNCPTLVSLFLQQNYVLRTIPSSFFELMPQLRVLDLSYTHIESLPMSLSSLVNLRALILISCRDLIEVPPLGHLKQLQFLNLRACKGIRELPQGIGELVNLESLDLSYLSRVTTIPCTTICSLSSLEELSMIGTPIKWAKEGGLEDVNEGTGYSLMELATLTHLYSLDIKIKDIDCLSQDSFHRGQLSSLRKFNFEFGENNMDLIPPHGDKNLCVYGCEYFPPCCKIIQEYAEGIGIYECNGLKRGISEIAGHSLTLRHLVIANCPQVDCIIDNGDVGHNIESMNLYGLSNLKKLIMGHGSLSLRQLKSLRIGSCKQLSGTLFSSNLVHHLDKLEYLGIRDCDKIEEIIEEGDNMLVLNNAFPSLRHLQLKRVKGLRSICSTRVSFNSLETMRIHGCTKLKKLPSCPSIKILKAEREWFEELNWEDGENTKSLFTNAFKEL